MREVDAALAGAASREVADVARRVGREATIVDGDVEDAGEDSERAQETVRDFSVASSDTQSWTSERRIDQISRSPQTGATWFFHARSSVM